MSSCARILLNGAVSSALPLLLTGCGHVPSLDIEDGLSRLYFRPTCVGAASSRTMVLRNTSGVHVGWRWAVSRKLQGVASVEPAVGVVHPAACHLCPWYRKRA